MKSNPNKSKRDLLIYQDFKQMFSEGKRIDFINIELGKKYFLAADTIAKIVNRESKKE